MSILRYFTNKISLKKPYIVNIEAIRLSLTELQKNNAETKKI